MVLGFPFLLVAPVFPLILTNLPIQLLASVLKRFNRPPSDDGWLCQGVGSERVAAFTIALAGEGLWIAIIFRSTWRA